MNINHETMRDTLRERNRERERVLTNFPPLGTWGGALHTATFGGFIYGWVVCFIYHVHLPKV